MTYFRHIGGGQLPRISKRELKEQCPHDFLLQLMGESQKEN